VEETAAAQAGEQRALLEEQLAATLASNTLGLVEVVRALQEENGARRAAARAEAAELRAQLAAREAAAVSHFCACIGSPCLRRCVHGASIGGGGVARGGGGPARGGGAAVAPVGRQTGPASGSAAAAGAGRESLSHGPHA
jgi:hypothetical protein